MASRAIAILVGAAALTMFAVALDADPAHASAYRYWTYWQATEGGAWTFGQQGPGTAVPQDGDVEGWSFRVSAEGGSQEASPSSAPDFAELCGSIQGGEGTKRVGLIIDPGPASIAPSGEVPIEAVATCVTAEVDATGYDVLRSVVEVRTDNGLICALGGYPEKECAPVLDDADVLALTEIDHGSASTGLLLDTPGSMLNSATNPGADAEPGSSNGSPLASLTVIALLAIGALQFVWLRRRRRS